MGFGGQGRTSLALSGQRPSSAAAGQDIADNHQQIKFNLRHGVQFHTGTRADGRRREVFSAENPGSQDRLCADVRLHGRGHVVQTGEQDFDKLNGELSFGNVAARGGARAIVTIDVDRVSDSCGMGVPLMQYQSERPQNLAWIQSQQKDGDNALLDRVAEWNVTSIDGLPAFDPTLLPRRPSSMAACPSRKESHWAFAYLPPPEVSSQA